VISSIMLRWLAALSASLLCNCMNENILSDFSIDGRSHEQRSSLPVPLCRTIPQELVDLIIDHVYSDKPTLAACSLVCRSWLVSTRHHLFSTVCLSQTQNALAFCELLESPLVTIQPFVRSLQISSIYGTRWIDEVIPRLEGLSAVTSLRLSIGLQSFSAKTWASLRSTFRMLVKLDMDTVQFHTLAEVVNVIYLFPFLEILVLAGNWNQICNDSSFPAAGQYTLPRHLHTLNISRPVAMLEWFLSQYPVLTVSRLHLSSIRMSELPCIGKYLKTTGSALQQLALNFNEYEPTPMGSAMAVDAHGSSLSHTLITLVFTLSQLSITSTNTSTSSTTQNCVSYTSNPLMPRWWNW